MKKLRFSGRAAIVCSLILAIGVPSVAMGFGEGRTLLLGKRNPSSNPSLALSNETEIIANNSTYATRQSNKRDGDGGGAVYGCRSSTGNEACIKSQNLKGGRAFEFNTVGTEAGRIETGSPAGAPFTTNATGVATGLNADRVDGKEATDFASAADLKTLSDSVAAAGTVMFATVDGANGSVSLSRPVPPAVKGSKAANVYTIDFGKDITKCSFTASPVGSAATQAPGVAATPGNANAVNVDTGAAPGSFHVQVIC